MDGRRWKSITAIEWPGHYYVRHGWWQEPGIGSRVDSSRDVARVVVG